MLRNAIFCFDKSPMRLANEYAKWLLGRSFACHFRQTVCTSSCRNVCDACDVAAFKPCIGVFIKAGHVPNLSKTCSCNLPELRRISSSRCGRGRMAERFRSKQESFPHGTFKENYAHVVQCRRCQRAQMDCSCMEGSQLSKLWLQAIRNSLTAWYIILPNLLGDPSTK